MSETKRVRCAVYTRKSSEEGLDQTFNSLHAQREACEAYVLSQKHEGWEVISTEYDDGGFSGGNMERPGLRKLLADIASKRVDTVVVYKVDRLTRSLTDFAKIVEQFDGQGVSFVSVTQQFNTTSSMGRLTLNVLLSFAQFEREVTGERIRDKIAASKRKGMWMGGVIPLGYDLQDRLLLPNEAEADRVRTIYRLYLELGCVSKLQAHLDAVGIRSKKRISKTGRATGDAVFSRGSLYELLQNPLYLGKVRHKDKTYPGLHPAIVPKELWDCVQAQIMGNAPRKRYRPTGSESYLLTGLLLDVEGNGFTPSHTTKKGRRYRYYVLRPTVPLLGGRRSSLLRLPARDIEEVVLKELAGLMRNPQRLASLVSAQPDDPAELDLIVQALAARSAPSGGGSTLLECVSRITIEPHCLRISLLPNRLRADIGLSERLREEHSCDLVCDVALKRAGSAMRFTLPAHAGASARSMPSLIRAVVNARDWLDRILHGEALNQRDLAKQTGHDERYISKILRLAFLAPDITEAILEENQPTEWNLGALVKNVPCDWGKQRENFGQ